MKIYRLYTELYIESISILLLIFYFNIGNNKKKLFEI